MAGLLGANAAAALNNQIFSPFGGIGDLSNLQFAPNIQIFNGTDTSGFFKVSGFGIPNLPPLPTFAAPQATATAAAPAPVASAGAFAGAGGFNFPSIPNFPFPFIYPSVPSFISPDFFNSGAQAQAQAQAGGLGGIGDIDFLSALLFASLLTGPAIGGGAQAQAGGFPPAPQPPARPQIGDGGFVAAPVANGGPMAQVIGDPHFFDFEGGSYDVMGRSGGIYNIISDKNLQYNAKFIGQEGATFLGTAAFKIGTEETGITKLEFSNGGAAPKINGQVMEKNVEYSFDSGLNDEQGRPVKATARWDGTNFIVNTGEYEVKLIDKGGNLDQEVRITSLGVRSDGVNPHGLLGQTADFDGKPRNGKKGVGAQGEGAIDGVYTDYEVTDLFGDNFKFSRFGSQANTQAQFGVGSGRTGAAN